MSYSFGGRDLIPAFNDKVAICKAPSKAEILALESTERPYRGNLDVSTCNIGEGTKAWAGLFKNELNKAEPFKAKYWAGIDCSGLVIRAGEASQGMLSNIIQPLSFWRTSCQYFYSNSVCKYHQENDTVLSITDTPSGFGYNFGEGDGKTDKSTEKIHKGDLLSYDGHVAIVHSNRASCDEEGDNCNYDIIHASGNPNICYSQGLKLPDRCDFNRKVVKNKINNRLRSNTLKQPIGFRPFMYDATTAAQQSVESYPKNLNNIPGFKIQGHHTYSLLPTQPFGNNFPPWHKKPHGENSGHFP